MTSTVTVELPDSLYQRLVNTAQAMQRPLEEVILRALMVRSPLDWSNVPEAFQANLAALDKLEDEALWVAARAERMEAEMERYEALLELKQERDLSEAEVSELARLWTGLCCGRLMLRCFCVGVAISLQWFLAWQSIFRAYQRQNASCTQIRRGLP